MPEAAPFATAADLARRLKTSLWTEADLEQVEDFLADASAHLREIIGWQVSPPAVINTRIAPTGSCYLRLPGTPITSVASVLVSGQALATTAYEVIDGALYRAGGWPSGATVTYTVGYTDPPRDLVSWTCVLASQALAAFEDLGALGGGGVSSVAIDDYRKAFAAGGEGVGFLLPERVERRLRERYAGGIFVTGSR